ncbi:hypothetical protein CVT26_015765 [Gymnopilus dilepis]|uniref:Uncharacterized protein n=1 Tax=Gymnopilus dilepis TaxID=231916 RepID=A0A409VFP5_9AGAR|nr:hypothetical protein CVT26_015765 [Gymnopilus dilepis]
MRPTVQQKFSLMGKGDATALFTRIRYTRHTTRFVVPYLGEAKIGPTTITMEEWAVKFSVGLTGFAEDFLSVWRDGCHDLSHELAFPDIVPILQWLTQKSFQLRSTTMR